MRIRARSQRGSALVVVLLIFSLAFALGVEVMYRQYHAQARTENLLGWNHRYQYAVAVEAVAIQGLIDDLEADQRDNEFLDDCVNEQWAVSLPPTPYGDAIVSATVQDLQGRFNLNSLVTGGAGAWKQEPEAITQLQALLAQLIPDQQKAVTLSQQMADWLDTNNLVDVPGGAEDAEYRIARTPNSTVLHESELRAMLGFAAEDIPPNSPFWSYFTALPPGTPINMNTAPKPVLSALFHNAGGEAAANAVIQAREKQPFAAAQDVLALSPFASLDAQARQQIDNRISVNSEYYQLSVDVKMDSGVTRLVSRLQRPQQGVTRVWSRTLEPVLGPLEAACNPPSET